ncbi:peroxiredoxin-6-like isoform X3 [Zootermopsis nevadensis]|uniref:peroxiredoxin-6-like isoform X3 n=1 Tax=Zootermopsis nevadensis TaxID=136037 RepID=UPI000B8E5049|nr:peroxiredoxin-6-like isoform X3 [Zootermopsis nevadensis]
MAGREFFTSVCLNCSLFCYTVQSCVTHDSWDYPAGKTSKQDIRTYFRNIPLEFPYPIISDESRELAVRLDMLDEGNRWDPVAANTIRALYVIGPDFTVKLSMFYPNTTGRNVQEMLRVIDSLQLTERLRVVTPADWTMGEEVMVSPEVQDKDLAKLFPRGVEKVRMPSGIAYVRKTRDYGHASECWDGSII